MLVYGSVDLHLYLFFFWSNNSHYRCGCVDENLEQCTTYLDQYELILSVIRECNDITPVLCGKMSDVLLNLCKEAIRSGDHFAQYP